MAVTDNEDPQAKLRRRLMAVDPVEAPALAPPIAPPAAPVAVPGREVNMAPVQAPAVQPGRVAAPAAPAPAAPAAPVAPAPAASGGGDKPWLDWINATYGQSQSRGTGFADLPQGVNLEQAIGRYNQETGAGAKYIGGPSGDRVDFGQGVTDALTSGGQLWSDYGAMGGQARNGASSGGGGQMTTNTGAGAAGGAGGGNDFQSQLRAMLMARMAAAGQPVDPTTGGINEAMTGARLEADRTTQMERTALAERRAASGDTSGSLEQGIQQSAERNAVGLGGLRAKLIQDEYNKKRTELQSYLQMALQTNDSQLARDVQTQLAQLDATLRREGYSLSAAQTAAELNQRTVEAGLR
jgi:hypothetical protein